MATSCIFIIGTKMGLLENYPDKDSWEAKVYCNQVSEPKYFIAGDSVQAWVVGPLISRFERELSLIPEAKQKEIREDVKPYLDEIKTGKISQTSIDFIASYLSIEQPKPVPNNSDALRQGEFKKSKPVNW